MHTGKEEGREGGREGGRRGAVVENCVAKPASTLSSSEQGCIQVSEGGREGGREEGKYILSIPHFHLSFFSPFLPAPVVGS